MHFLPPPGGFWCLTIPPGHRRSFSGRWTGGELGISVTFCQSCWFYIVVQKVWSQDPSPLRCQKGPGVPPMVTWTPVDLGASSVPCRFLRPSGADPYFACVLADAGPGAFFNRTGSTFGVTFMPPASTVGRWPGYSQGGAYMAIVLDA